MRQALLAAALLAGGCATRPEAATLPPAACDAGKAQGFVGEGADQAEAARQAAGAKSVRVLRPGQPATMDYRGDRLNVVLDAEGRIATLRCG